MRPGVCTGNSDCIWVMSHVNQSTWKQNAWFQNYIYGMAIYGQNGQLHFFLVQFSCSVVSDSLWSHGLQHNRLPYPSPAHGACSNSSPSSQWCHSTILSSVIPFLPSIRVFSNESVLHIRWPKYWSFSFSMSPSNGYSGLISFRWTGWISLQSEGLSRVFSNTTVEQNQFFSAQLSL